MTASRAPRAIITRPPAPPRRSRRRGEAPSTSRAVPASSGPAAVADHGDHGEDRPEGPELHAGRRRGVGVDELRQHGGQEQDRLRVGDAHEEPLAQQAAVRPRRRGGVEHHRHRPAVPDRLHAEVDEVGGAGQLQRGEHRGRPLHEASEAHRQGDDVDVEAACVAQHRQERGPPAEGHAPADDEQHAGPGHEDQARTPTPRTGAARRRAAWSGLRAQACGSRTRRPTCGGSGRARSSGRRCRR